MALRPHLTFLCAGLLVGQGETSLLRGRGPEGSAFEIWKPPPSYLVESLNHRTMYLVDVTVGSQPFRLLVDTGSSLLVVPNVGCRTKACAAHRRFDSSSSKDIHRTASVQYKKGSVRGRIFEDRLCVDNTALEEVSLLQRSSAQSQGQGRLEAGRGCCANVSFLAADEESDELAGLPYDGILGLGLEEPEEEAGVGLSVIDSLAKAGQVASTSFALRLGDSGESAIAFGDMNERDLVGNQILWVPLSSRTDGFWQFNIADFSLGGTPLGFGQLDVCVDSGTSLLSADEPIRSWLREHVQPKDCKEVDSLPPLGLLLHDGSTLPLLPADYVDQVQDGCQLSLMPTNFQSVNGQRMILGDSFLRRYVTIFDRKNRRIGFGISPGDRLAAQLLPAMFPTTTTLPAPTTTPGPPPKLNVDYIKDVEYQPPTTPAPPSEEEVQKRELTQALAKMPDDLDGDFDRALVREKRNAVAEMHSAAEKAEKSASSPVPPEHQPGGEMPNPRATEAGAGASGNAYLDLLK